MIMFAFIISSYFGSIIFFEDKPSKFKHIIFLSIGFSIIAYILDIFLTFSYGLDDILIYSILDLPLKFLLSLIGGTIFFFIGKVLNSKVKFLFSTIGLINRRLNAGLADINVILIFIGILDMILSLTSKIGISIKDTNTILLIEIMMVLAYKILYETMYNQTPGKKLMNIVVKGNLLQIVIRNLNIFLFYLISLDFVNSSIFGQILALFIVIDTVMLITGRRLLDYLAGTKISSV